MGTPLEDAFDGLVDALREQARWITRHPFYEDEENRASAFSFLVQMLLARIEELVSYDPSFPAFRIVDPRIREGGDNPDQRYAIARLQGGETYRIWGRIASERRVDLQIYAGDPYVFGSGGRSAGYLPHEELTIDADGRFSVLASPERPDGDEDWIECPSDATRILVRQVYAEWSDAAPGEVHIDRVGGEGALAPVLTQEAMTARLEAATANLVTHVQVWPEILRQFYVEGQPTNRVSTPMDPGSVGGVAGRFMCHAVWDLAPDEALLLTLHPMDGDYQGVQLADLWWSSLEYGNRQTSLTAEQTRPSTDGSFTYVLSGVDPGVANWLDTTGRRRGVAMLRFDGMRSAEFDPDLRPTARVVPLAELPVELPPGDHAVTPSERATTIAARRRHVQRRFGI
jgi:hypothetical protein